MRAFRLKKDLPLLNKGVVFVYDRENKSRLGSVGAGCMILAWDSGQCQYGDGPNNGWCGATFILPGQVHTDTEFFEEIENPPSGASKSKHRYYITIETTTTVRTH